MEDKENKKEKKNNSTLNGEFIPSYFTWETLDGQKKKADKLANITEKNKE